MKASFNGAFAQIGPLTMYYEIHGDGEPLVLLHGGGSTIESNYGRILKLLAKQNKVVAVELQAHGRTADINRPLRFEQDADDVATLLDLLQIDRAHVMGFSNGGTTAMQFAIRHPQKLRRLVIASANFSRAGMPPGFFEGMEHAKLGHMPPLLRDAFLAVNPDEAALQKMFSRDVARMLLFEDIPRAMLQSIKAPTLILNGDRDVIQPAHVLELSQLIDGSRLMILLSEHGGYLGEVCSADPGETPAYIAGMIGAFLAERF